METLNPSISDLHVPSGLEVESASWRTRLTTLPKQQLERVRPRVMEMKSKVAAGASGAATKVNGELHAKPALYAGIAAGLGFALGLTGRIARHRRHALKHMPTLVVIEEAC
jgi:hypothetical protein